MAGIDLITAGLDALPAGYDTVATGLASPKYGEDCSNHYDDPYGYVSTTMSKTRRKAILRRWAGKGGILLFEDEQFRGNYSVFKDHDLYGRGPANLAEYHVLRIADDCTIYQVKRWHLNGNKFLWWNDLCTSLHKWDGTSDGKVIWIYSDANYKGSQLKLGVGEFEQPDMSNWSGWNDILSSFKFYDG